MGLKVKVVNKMGYIYLKRRRIGDVFEIATEQEFSWAWMEAIGWTPTKEKPRYMRIKGAPVQRFLKVKPQMEDDAVPVDPNPHEDDEVTLEPGAEETGPGSDPSPEPVQPPEKTAVAPTEALVATAVAPTTPPAPTKPAATKKKARLGTGD